MALYLIVGGTLWQLMMPGAWPLPWLFVIAGAVMLGDKWYLTRCARQDARRGA